MTYIILFLSAFISATLFPFGSEAFLIYNLNENYNIIFLIAFATLGNVLGSLLNYFLGLKGEEFLERKKLIKEEKIKKYKNLFNKYGSYILLLSWAPVFGDPLTFIAGVLKYDLKKFLILVFLAKLGRYIFVSSLTLYFM